MMLSSAAAAAVLVVLTAQGALAAQFSLSGIPFVIHADHLHGDGFEQWAALDGYDKQNPAGNKTGGTQLVFVSGIRSADITNLCQSINMGGIYLKLTAGTPTNHVKASTMIVDSDSLKGDLVQFSNISIGQDATTMTQVPGAVVVGSGPPDQPGTVGHGMFGQQADVVDIDNLRQNNYAATAASFTLPNLSMSFASSGC